ncbi:AraC family ligand binding domain-containing protein [Salmonella enterica subsp. enterica]|nr:AraC family ligand binding domain-containing protein [Salmonella enterica subsp. enterica]
MFPPGEIHHYGRHPDQREWYHQWVLLRPRAYWQEVADGRQSLPRRDFSARTRRASRISAKLFRANHQRRAREGRYSDYWPHDQSAGAAVACSAMAVINEVVASADG